MSFSVQGLEDLVGSFWEKLDKVKTYLRKAGNPTKAALGLIGFLAARYVGVKTYKKIKKLPPGNIIFIVCKI